jgi:N-acetylmuramoyl-L-alanine amidase
MKKSLKLIAGLAVIASFAFTNPQKNDPRIINIVIDAGHGGTDNGATFEKITEKEIVEQISNKIKEQNKFANVIINFTRTEDRIPTLQQRADFINQVKPDLVLSLHVNQVPNNTISGMRILISGENDNSGKSEAYAKKFSNVFALKNIKVGEIQKVKSHFLQNCKSPAMVVELGYLSNEQDRKWLTDDREQTKIADMILKFIGEIK